MVGNQSIKLKDVRRIVDPRLNQKDQNSRAAAVPDLKAQAPKKETGEKGAEEIPIGGEQPVMDQVGLSREMMNRLGRETKPETPNANPRTAQGPSPSQGERNK